MPTIETKKTRAERTCEKCRTTIPKGGEYRSWAHFRQKPHVVCMAPTCTPTKADLTGSEKLSRLYVAQETARAAVSDAGSPEEIAEALREAADIATEVADEYREAASAFGDQGPNAEKADEIEPWADDLQSAADDCDDFDEDAAKVEIMEEAALAALASLKCAVEVNAKVVDAVADEEDLSPDEIARVALRTAGAVDADIVAFDAALEIEVDERVSTKRDDYLEECRDAAQEAIDNLSV